MPVEVEVFAELLRIHPFTALLVGGVRSGKEDAIANTLAAMESGVPLVPGGWLPDDVVADEPAGLTSSSRSTVATTHGRQTPQDLQKAKKASKLAVS